MSTDEGPPDGCLTAGDLIATIQLLASTKPGVRVVIVDNLPHRVPWRVHKPTATIYIADWLTLDQSGWATAEAITALRAHLNRPILTLFHGGRTDRLPLTATGSR